MIDNGEAYISGPLRSGGDDYYEYYVRLLLAP